MFFERKKLPTAEELEGFFFRAMNAVGWASSTLVILPHPIIKDWDYTFYAADVRGMWLHFNDQWGPDGIGSTTIDLVPNENPRRHLPLWSMQYGGAYRKPVMPFLKGRLRAAYTANQFIGGRGVTMKSSDFAYYNHLDSGSSFKRFSGHETAHENIGDTGEGDKWNESGSHWYRGGLLV